MEIINLKNEYEYIESYNNIQKVISNVYQMSGGWYEIERYGQEPVWVGNKVRVNLYIYLPMEPGSSDDIYRTIKEHLWFFGRLIFAGNILHMYWGYSVNNYGARCVNISFTAKTWNVAFNKAKRYAEREFSKLEKALIKREQALLGSE